MERFGFVGLPNAGKSSLYNALSGGSVLAAPYPFATKDPNVGMAKVPDRRLELLARAPEPHEAADDLVAVPLEQRGGDRTVDAARHGEEHLHARESTRWSLRGRGRRPGWR